VAPAPGGPRIIDRIENERRLRAELGLSPAVQSARLARQAIANGTTHIRTHVDVDTEVGLAGLQGLVATRQALTDAVTMQIVAFPQSGVMIRPGTVELLEEAVKQGADLVGGLDPAAIDGDPRGQLDGIFAIAERHRAGVDIHLHDPGELGAFQVELIAERTTALGLQGRSPSATPSAWGWSTGSLGWTRRAARRQPHRDHDPCAGRSGVPADSSAPRRRRHALLRIRRRPRRVDALR
jgi:cytosine/adenosine deaminase-related metal-dependent hydrolase